MIGGVALNFIAVLSDVVFDPCGHLIASRGHSRLLSTGISPSLTTKRHANGEPNQRENLDDQSRASF